MLDFITYPFANLLLLLYRYMGHQTVVAIAALTILIRLLILPLTLSQQRSAQKMQELQPEIEKLREKYGDDQEKLAQEQMKLWRKAGVNPMGGCLPLLIQLPIMIALYRAIIFCVPSTPIQLFQFSGHIFIDEWLPSLSGLVPLQSTFLGMGLGQPPSPAQWWSYALPILVFATSWLQQRLLTPPTASGDGQSQAEMMNQQMQVMMPLMFGFISLQYATGLSIYFIISNLFGMAQYYFIRMNREEESEETLPQRRRRPKK
ncbi:MAG: YidC/Oxa1 family membrane protein insertase [Chloroflexota bacterium]|nr:YidC/Oxa1 family membrane protein insertase [Chloroflexota bacterium]